MERCEKTFLIKPNENEDIEQNVGGFDKHYEEEEIKERQESLLKRNATNITNAIKNHEKRCKDLKTFKIISSFDVIRNLSYLNKKSEPLTNQEKLIVLSAIKFVTLFFIVWGENSYIILKYVENKMSVLYFCKHLAFFFIKLGMNSYETYKVICGILFGYKFISYYYDNKDKSICIKMVIFATKPIPYILLFFILHFILFIQYLFMLGIYLVI